MLDKILLVLLVLLLPIGLFVGKNAINKASSEEASDEIQANGATATVEDLEVMLKELQQGGKPIATPTQPVIVINEGEYASESGTLRISGIAPNVNRAVMVSATVLPANVAQPQEVSSENQDENGVLGQAVEVRSIKTQPSGGFTFEYETTLEEGIVELVFEQKPALKVVQFDLSTGRQVNY